MALRDVKITLYGPPVDQVVTLYKKIEISNADFPHFDVKNFANIIWRTVKDGPDLVFYDTGNENVILTIEDGRVNGLFNKYSVLEGNEYINISMGNWSNLVALDVEIDGIIPPTKPDTANLIEVTHDVSTVTDTLPKITINEVFDGPDYQSYINGYIKKATENKTVTFQNYDDTVVYVIDSTFLKLSNFKFKKHF